LIHGLPSTSRALPILHSMRMHTLMEILLYLTSSNLGLNLAVQAKVFVNGSAASGKIKKNVRMPGNPSSIQKSK